MYHPVSQSISTDIFFLIDPVKPFYRTADIFLNEVELVTDFGYFPTLFPQITMNKAFNYNMEFREQTVTTDPTQFKFAIADFYFRKSQ